MFQCKHCIDKDNIISQLRGEALAQAETIRLFEDKKCHTCEAKDSEIQYLRKQVHELNNRLMELIGIYHVSSGLMPKVDSVFYPPKDDETLKKEKEEHDTAIREIMGQ